MLIMSSIKMHFYVKKSLIHYKILVNMNLTVTRFVVDI